jgi:dTDP-4-amino-4,6-dideoxygalactose transaminase
VEWDVPLADVVISDADLAAVTDAYRSGWLSIGPRTAAFEAAFGAYVGTRHAIAVSSGTAALHLMCLAAGLAPGAEVVVPSMTFVATVNAIRYTGARPVFADIAGPHEPWLSAERCRASVGEATRAILHVPYGGHPGDVARLRQLADEHGIPLLLDAAHAIGARVDGRPIAGFGASAAFSFFSNKNLAIGEGGMVTTDDDEIARRVRLLRSHGMTALSWDRTRGHAVGYDVVELGYNYRLDEPRAALGSSRLARLDEDTRRRAALSARYRERLSDVVDCVRAAEPPAESAHHLFTIVLPEGTDRERFRARLAEARIQTSVHYPPVHHFGIYAAAATADLPETDRYGARTVTLPLFAHMTEDQLDRVTDAVAAALGGV